MRCHTLLKDLLQMVEAEAKVAQAPCPSAFDFCVISPAASCVPGLWQEHAIAIPAEMGRSEDDATGP